MKVKTGFLAIAILVVGLAQADVLYWQVADSVSTGAILGEGANQYAYARLTTGTATESEGVESWVLGTSSSEAGTIYVNLNSAEAAPLLADLGDGYAAQSFWVELYSAQGNWVGKTEAVSGTDLAAYVHDPVSFTPGDVATLSVWMVTLPEPTSGVLVLIGAGLLGLRRKRRV